MYLNILFRSHFVSHPFFGKQEKIFAETRKTSCICPRKNASTYSSKFVCLYIFRARYAHRFSLPPDGVDAAMRFDRFFALKSVCFAYLFARTHIGILK